VKGKVFIPLLAMASMLIFVTVPHAIDTVPLPEKPMSTDSRMKVLRSGDKMIGTWPTPERSMIQTQDVPSSGGKTVAQAVSALDAPDGSPTKALYVDNNGKVMIGSASTPSKYNFDATSLEVRGYGNPISGPSYAARISNSGGSGSGLIIQAGYRHNSPKAIEVLRLAPFDQPAEFIFFNDGRSSGLSDARLKTKVRTLDNVLERLSKVRGVNFEWLKGSGEQIGLIAQEVEEVFPELVSEMDNYKGVDYARFSAVLVQAVKELNAETKNLAAANQELRLALEEQREMIGELQTALQFKQDKAADLAKVD
jgi:hypothetical protein